MKNTSIAVTSEASVVKRMEEAMLRALGIIGAALVAFCATTAPALAQKQLTVIVPYAPGGNFDVIARMVGELARPYLGDDNWIVLNKPGGGGNNAINDFMRAKPDGQTILFIPGSAFLQPYVRDVKWTSPDDFAPIAIVANSPNVYYVKQDAKWNDAQELLAAAKAEPDQISIGVPSLFATHAIVDAVLKRKGIKFLSVPYAGDALIAKDVLGGHLAVGTGAVGSTSPYLDAKSFRGWAVVSRSRLPKFPEIPTFIDLGYPVAAENFIIVVAPKGTPAERVAFLSSAIQRATGRPEYKEFTDKTGILPETSFGADLTKQLAEQAAIFKEYAPDVQYLKDR